MKKTIISLSKKGASSDKTGGVKAAKKLFLRKNAGNGVRKFRKSKPVRIFLSMKIIPQNEKKGILVA